MACMTIVRSRVWKNRKATTMLAITVMVGTASMEMMSMTSGIMSKKETPMRAPAAKAKKYFTGIRVFFRVKMPPTKVEKKVTATKNKARIGWAKWGDPRLRKV